MKTRMMFAVLALLGGSAVSAQEIEEIVVTGTRAEGSAIPGTSLKRPGDFLLLMVEVSNDSRDEKTRNSEIVATLRAMLAAAAKDKSIELSVIGDRNIPYDLLLAVLYTAGQSELEHFRCVVLKKVE